MVAHIYTKTTQYTIYFERVGFAVCGLQLHKAVVNKWVWVSVCLADGLQKIDISRNEWRSTECVDTKRRPTEGKYQRKSLTEEKFSKCNIPTEQYTNGECWPMSCHVLNTRSCYQYPGQETEHIHLSCHYPNL